MAWDRDPERIPCHGKNKLLNPRNFPWHTRVLCHGIVAYGMAASHDMRQGSLAGGIKYAMAWLGIGGIGTGRQEQGPELFPLIRCHVTGIDGKGVDVDRAILTQQGLVCIFSIELACHPHAGVNLELGPLDSGMVDHRPIWPVYYVICGIVGNGKALME